MNKADVIRWAREAGCLGPGEGGDPEGIWEPNGENITEIAHKLAALAYAAGAEAEREALRQITPEVIEAGCEALYGHTRAEAIEWAKEDKFDGYAYTAEQAFRMMIDAAIRARGNGGE